MVTLLVLLSGCAVTGGLKQAQIETEAERVALAQAIVAQDLEAMTITGANLNNELACIFRERWRCESK